VRRSTACLLAGHARHAPPKALCSTKTINKPTTERQAKTHEWMMMKMMMMMTRARKRMMEGMRDRDKR
jgi:hypothetical protein